MTCLVSFAKYKNYLCLTVRALKRPQTITAGHTKPQYGNKKSNYLMDGKKNAIQIREIASKHMALLECQVKVKVPNNLY